MFFGTTFVCGVCFDGKNENIEMCKMSLREQLSASKSVENFVKVLDNYMEQSKTNLSVLPPNKFVKISEIVNDVLNENYLDPARLFTELWQKNTLNFQFLSIRLIPTLMKKGNEDILGIIETLIPTIHNEEIILNLAEKICEMFVPKQQIWATFLDQLSKCNLIPCQITLQYILYLLILEDKLSVDQAIKLKLRDNTKEKTKPDRVLHRIITKTRNILTKRIDIQWV